MYDRVFVFRLSRKGKMLQSWQSSPEGGLSMRYLKVILVVLAAAAIGYAAAPKSPYELPCPADKLAWLSSEAKQPCGKTAFEWRLAANAIRADSPVKIMAQFDVATMTAAVTERGLLVNITVKLRPGISIVTISDWERQVHGACRYGADLARERFGLGGMFEDTRNMYVVVSMDDRVIGVQTLNFQKSLARNASPAEQRAAVTELMGK
jgi:hypothetical protein